MFLEKRRPLCLDHGDPPGRGMSRLNLKVPLLRLTFCKLIRHVEFRGPQTDHGRLFPMLPWDRLTRSVPSESLCIDAFSILRWLTTIFRELASLEPVFVKPKLEPIATYTYHKWHPVHVCRTRRTYPDKAGYNSKTTFGGPFPNDS